jgi:hypothetical protein
MATHGEERWPPVGRLGGRLWGAFHGRRHTESLTEHAVAAEKLVRALPMPSRYEHLQQAHDPWLNSWIEGDPVRDLTALVLKQIANRVEPPSHHEFAASLLHDFF